MPPGAVTLDDMDLDQVSVDCVLNCAKKEPLDTEEVEEVLSLSKSQSLNSSQVQELTVDDIDEFEDDDPDEVDTQRYSRRVLNDASDVVLGLPSFATGLIDDDLRETAYEILLAAAGALGGLIVPSEEKKKEKKSRLTRKLGRSKSEHVTQSHNSPGLVGLLETMHVQMEINYTYHLKHFLIVLGSYFFYLH
ncbi:uncharacterized protein Fot_32457 [Forsythia ovata]|uniref:Uncharacterized protein n=1 Tax=Forsythia ovata TaxID=205694 RepID=A0ABD1T806_9LAMI